MLPQLNFPEYSFKIKGLDSNNQRTEIFDVIRKKYVVLTPEEWVRQHVIHFLANENNYPKSLMKIESGHQLNKLQKRTDLIVYNKMGIPVLLAECKAPTIKIGQSVFDQIASYQNKLHVHYLFVTNGLSHFIFTCDVNNKSFSFLKKLPTIEELNSFTTT